jgi:hypothetical protein
MKRMVAQNFVSAWRTAQIAEKFGIIASAFKAEFLCSGIIPAEP